MVCGVGVWCWCVVLVYGVGVWCIYGVGVRCWCSGELYLLDLANTAVIVLHVHVVFRSVSVKIHGIRMLEDFNLQLHEWAGRHQSESLAG